jgi:hypothetical protein
MYKKTISDNELLQANNRINAAVNNKGLCELKDTSEYMKPHDRRLPYLDIHALVTMQLKLLYAVEAERSNAVSVFS